MERWNHHLSFSLLHFYFVRNKNMLKALNLLQSEYVRTILLISKLFY